jgi:hypothetical protein
MELKELGRVEELFRRERLQPMIATARDEGSETGLVGYQTPPGSFRLAITVDSLKTLHQAYTVVKTRKDWQWYATAFRTRRPETGDQLRFRLVSAPLTKMPTREQQLEYEDKLAQSLRVILIADVEVVS